MPTVERYKTRLVRRLGELEALGRDCVLSFRRSPSDVAIRALAELDVDGVIVFEDDSLACRLTAFGSQLAAALMKRERK